MGWIVGIDKWVGEWGLISGLVSKVCMCVGGCVDKWVVGGWVGKWVGEQGVVKSSSCSEMASYGNVLSWVSTSRIWKCSNSPPV